MNVSIFRRGDSVVPFHNGRSVLGVVEEVEAVAALSHMYDDFAMQRVFRTGISGVSIVVVGKTVLAEHALNAYK